MIAEMTVNDAQTILIAEDSPTQAEQLRCILEQHSFNVAVCSNGREALVKAKDLRPSVVISDIMMPEMDGYELCRSIKAEEDLAAIPVILLTQLSDAKEVLRGLECGAHNFIVKPYDEEALVKRVQYVIDSRRGAAAGIPAAEGHQVRPADNGIEVCLGEERHAVACEPERILDFLLSTYENAVAQNRELQDTQLELEATNEQLEDNLRELRASEERFRTVVMTVPDVVYRIDVDGRFTFLNDAVQSLGYEPDELVGEHFSRIVAVEDVENVRRDKVLPHYVGKTMGPDGAPKLFDERRTGGRRTTGLEVRLLPKGQQTTIPGLVEQIGEDSVTVEVSSSGLYETNPYTKERVFVGSVGVIRDIRERKQAESQIRFQNALLEAQSQASIDGILVLSEQQQVVSCNDRFREIWGVCAGDIGEDAGQAIVDELASKLADPEGFQRTVDRLQGEPDLTCQEEMQTRDGRTLECYSAPVTSKDGTRYGRVWYWRDITDRKQAEEALREHRDHLADLVSEQTGELRQANERLKAEAAERQALLELHRTVTAAIPSALLVLDASLNVLMANDRYCKWQQVAAADIEGKHVEDVLPFPLLAERSLMEGLQSAVERECDDLVLELTYESEAHLATHLNVRVCGVRSESANQKESRVLLVLDDVTQQKQLEEDFRQATKMETVGRLAGGVAHDFNNVLTGIRGYTQLLLSETEKETGAHADLVQIQELSDRAANLTRQLLAFSRKQKLARVPLALNGLVENAMKMLRRLIGEDIELEFAPGPDLGTVHADPGQIEQVLMNLAVNARDAMPDGGTLAIETENVHLDEEYARLRFDAPAGAYVMLVVSDTGSGMDDQTRERIFEPFFTTKEQGKGTGLGLATVYGIVKQHEGSICVYSEPGLGTTFKTWLPRVDAAADSPAEKPDTLSVQGGNETVLLVEDEEAVREIARRTLTAHGYTVICASEPADADGVFADRGDEVDLLLTDVVMPGRSGPALYEGLAAQRPSLRVLYMSGYTDHAIEQHGVLAEGVAFMHKPFGPEMLLQRVRQALDT